MTSKTLLYGKHRKTCYFNLGGKIIREQLFLTFKLFQSYIGFPYAKKIVKEAQQKNLRDRIFEGRGERRNALKLIFKIEDRIKDFLKEGFG